MFAGCLAFLAAGLSLLMLGGGGSGTSGIGGNTGTLGNSPIELLELLLLVAGRFLDRLLDCNGC